jgi:DNA polymerase III subunit epsilon
MLDLSLSEIPLVFLDTETTGLSPRFGDRVVEIALARFRGGVMENFYSTLVNPERSISPGATRVHGITNLDVADSPRFREIAALVCVEMEGAVIVGHNARFDLGFMTNEFQIARVNSPANLALDTLTLLRRFFSFRSNALQNVADSLGIERITSHRALADVLTTREVFEYILSQLAPSSLRELLHMQGGPIPWADTTAREELPLPPALEEALRSRRRLFLRYVDESGYKTERWVSVLRVWSGNDYIYLRAHCHLRDAERSFRLDRVVEMRIED